MAEHSLQTIIWQDQTRKEILIRLWNPPLYNIASSFLPDMMDFKLKPTKHYKSMEERVWTSLSGFSKSVDELSKGFSWEELAGH